MHMRLSGTMPSVGWPPNTPLPSRSVVLSTNRPPRRVATSDRDGRPLVLRLEDPPLDGVADGRRGAHLLATLGGVRAGGG